MSQPKGAKTAGRTGTGQAAAKAGGSPQPLAKAIAQLRFFWIRALQSPEREDQAGHDVLAVVPMPPPQAPVELNLTGITPFAEIRDPLGYLLGRLLWHQGRTGGTCLAELVFLERVAAGSPLELRLVSAAGDEKVTLRLDAEALPHKAFVLDRLPDGSLQGQDHDIPTPVTGAWRSTPVLLRNDMVLGIDDRLAYGYTQNRNTVTIGPAFYPLAPPEDEQYDLSFSAVRPAIRPDAQWSRSANLRRSGLEVQMILKPRKRAAIRGDSETFKKLVRLCLDTVVLRYHIRRAVAKHPALRRFSDHSPQFDRLLSHVTVRSLFELLRRVGEVAVDRTALSSKTRQTLHRISQLQHRLHPRLDGIINYMDHFASSGPLGPYVDALFDNRSLAFELPYLADVAAGRRQPMETGPTTDECLEAVHDIMSVALQPIMTLTDDALLTRNIQSETLDILAVRVGGTSDPRTLWLAGKYAGEVSAVMLPAGLRVVTRDDQKHDETDRLIMHHVGAAERDFDLHGAVAAALPRFAPGLLDFVQRSRGVPPTVTSPLARPGPSPRQADRVETDPLYKSAGNPISAPHRPLRPIPWLLQHLWEVEGLVPEPEDETTFVFDSLLDATRTGWRRRLLRAGFPLWCATVAEDVWAKLWHDRVTVAPLLATGEMDSGELAEFADASGGGRAIHAYLLRPGDPELFRNLGLQDAAAVSRFADAVVAYTERLAADAQRLSTVGQPLGPMPAGLNLPAAAGSALATHAGRVLDAAQNWPSRLGDKANASLSGAPQPLTQFLRDLYPDRPGFDHPDTYRRIKALAEANQETDADVLELINGDPLIGDLCLVWADKACITSGQAAALLSQYVDQGGAGHRDDLIGALRVVTIV